MSSTHSSLTPAYSDLLRFAPPGPLFLFQIRRGQYQAILRRYDVFVQGDIAVAKSAITFMEARASKRLRSVRTIDDANFRQIQASKSDHVISPTKLLKAAIAVTGTFVA